MIIENINKNYIYFLSLCFNDLNEISQIIKYKY